MEDPDVTPSSPHPVAMGYAPVARPPSFSARLVDTLHRLGVRHAFGIVGGGIAPFCDVLGRGVLSVCVCRHEAGAAFAATEASLATGTPTVVFATTGPGATNALTGMAAARWDGARVILVTGATATNRRGRWAVQETSDWSLPGLLTSHALFDVALTIESPDELPELAARLATGLSRRGGFTAHVILPLPVQRAPCKSAAPGSAITIAPPTAAPEVLEAVGQALEEDSFALWVGYGARTAVAEVKAFAERTGAAVITTPRAKGVFPEDHPLSAGVSGFAGHQDVERYMAFHQPARLLVLGSRLGEHSSGWDRRLVPSKGFIHVDLDPTVFGAAYPDVPVLPVVSDVGNLLRGLLARPPRQARRLPAPTRTPREVAKPRSDGLVRPRVLMDVLQKVFVDGSDATVMAEAGNSFAWTNHYLRFATPRYRISGLWGSMGHMVAGGVGAALASRRPSVVVTGDAAMLMLSEINSAVRYRAHVVWIVLNDARFGITDAGMRAQGFTPLHTDIPRCDFVAIARGMGADGERVDTEDQLKDAMVRALMAGRPYVLDVQVDTSEPAPFMRRIHSLDLMGGARASDPRTPGDA